MRINAISIGDEILRGDTLNTNLAYLGRALQREGLTLTTEICVPDDLDAIRGAAQPELRLGSILITIGGLGPTQDDLTRQAFAELLQRPLVHSHEVERSVRDVLRLQARAVPDAAVKAQSVILTGADIMPNRNGTAPGLWCTETNGAVVAMLPGPPTEFEPMVELELLPRIRQRRTDIGPRCRRIVVCGLPESVVEKRTMDALGSDHGLRLAFCAGPLGVDVCISHPSSETALDDAEEHLRGDLQEQALPKGCSDICEAIGTALLQRGYTLATAESCTAGLVAAALTRRAGASTYFKGGVVAYANEAKEDLLGVQGHTLAAHGAVSVETVTEMLAGARQRFQAQAAIAVSGIAGPGGGTPEKPVGTVVIGVAVADAPPVVRSILLPGNRETVRVRAVGQALVMLRQALLKIPPTRQTGEREPAMAKEPATGSKEGRDRNLSLALGQIEKEFGKGTIRRLGDSTHEDVPTISTGALALDIALGIGGLPRGRIVEIYGAESSGKTTVCLHVIANAQKAGGICAFIDTEHALDPAYAGVIGVNVDDLLVSQPDCGEDALNIAETLVRSNAIDVLVIDSVAALVPRAEIEGQMGDTHVGLQARLMSQALRKLTGAISRSRTCIIFTNQIREKIGVMFGNPETTTGGRALKFYASIRLEIRRVTTIKAPDGQPLGSRTKVKVVKNKMAPPFQVAEFDIMYSEGISRAGSILDVATEMKLLEKRGSWFSFDNTQIGQGREQSKQAIDEDLDLQGRLLTKIREKLAEGNVKINPGSAASSPQIEEDDDADPEDN